MRRAAVRSLATLAALACTVALRAAAQSGSPTSIVTGVVTDAGRATPIPEVQVRLGGTAIGARTDSAGRFVLRGIGRGAHPMVVRRIGYVGDSTEIDVRGDTTVVEFALLADPTRLAAVRVESRSAPRRLQEFETRRRMHNGGYFLDDSTLAREAARALPDVLATLPAVDVRITTDGRHYVQSRRMPVRLRNNKLVPCPLKIFLNGMPLADSTITDFATADLAGVEVHDPANTPVQYRGTGSDCGVVLLWSR